MKAVIDRCMRAASDVIRSDMGRSGKSEERMLLWHCFKGEQEYKITTTRAGLCQKIVPLQDRVIIVTIVLNT